MSILINRLILFSEKFTQVRQDTNVIVVIKMIKVQVKNPIME